MSERRARPARRKSAGYSGTPLPQKLGIRPDGRALLVTAPPHIEALLGALPEGARVSRRAGGSCDLVILFVRTASELAKRLPRAVELARDAKLWIAWPKKGSALESDVGGDEVRAAGLAAGLVDFKVCAIDETWSGLCFARRKR